MVAAAWLMLSSLFYSQQLSTGSFPKPLTEEEEHHYLALTAEGDLEVRNVMLKCRCRILFITYSQYENQPAGNGGCRNAKDSNYYEKR